MGDEDDWKEGLMKTGDWGELAPFMMMVVSDFGCIRLDRGPEVSAGLYMAYCADIAPATARHRRETRAAASGGSS